MQRELSNKDILGWDVKNWSNALLHWEKVIPKDKKLMCLEIGANKGGLSLWLAAKGHSVVCNDIKPTPDEIKKHHSSLKLKGEIEYQCFDAVEIPYENHFDVIILKSVLGGVGREGKDERIEKSINEIYKALKPGGIFLFAENLRASKFHSFFRKNFVRWAKDWNYMHYSQIKNYLNKFTDTELHTAGFMGAFGFNEASRNVFGHFDSVVFNNLPKGYHYIVYGHAKK